MSGEEDEDEDEMGVVCEAERGEECGGEDAREGGRSDMEVVG